MFKRQVKQLRYLSAAAVLVALTVSSNPSEARTYTTRWDPLFNFAFTGNSGLSLGWKGSAEINVPNAGCLIQDTANLVLPATCGLVTLDSANIEFYDTGTLAPIDTLEWPPLPLAGSAPSALSVDSNGDVNGMVLAMDLNGFITLGGVDYDVTLNFGLGGVLPDSYGLPVMTLIENDGGTAVGPLYVSGLVADCAECKVTAVWIPEPASLALVGVALTALGLVRRRKA